MEEKITKKISILTFLLIVALIAIIVMGVFIYKLNNEKTLETQKSANLQEEVDNLNNTVDNLQYKIDTISLDSNRYET